MATKIDKDTQILVVSDRGKRATDLCDLLAHQGFAIQLVSNEDDILPSIHKLEPSLVVLMLSLPNERGLQACKAIKDDDWYDFLPVMMITPAAEADLRVDSVRSGADEYLVEPLLEPAVVARVRSLLRIKDRFDILVHDNQQLNKDLAKRNRQLEKALQAEIDLANVKKVIIRNVNHELRTPVLQVKGAVDLLTKVLTQSKNETPTQEEIERTYEEFTELAMASEAAERLEGILTNIALLEKSEEINLNPIMPQDCVDYALYVLTKRHPNKDDLKRIELRYDSKLPLVMTDYKSVGMALQLILDNALKFSPGGDPVEVYIKPTEEGLVWFAVRDHGIGIAKKHHKRIFDSLYQVETKTNRRFGGAGTGLSVVKAIMDELNTWVEVDSALGKGSTFSFPIPQATQNDLDNL